MTGFKSKRAAALDEEGMYLVHQTAQLKAAGLPDTPTARAYLDKVLDDDDTQAAQEPVAYLCENAVGHKYFRWKKPSSTYKPIPLYTRPLQRTDETDEEIKAKCPRTDSIWSLGWYEGYKACNKNTAQAYLKGFDEGERRYRWLRKEYAEDRETYLAECVLSENALDEYIDRQMAKTSIKTGRWSGK